MPIKLEHAMNVVTGEVVSLQVEIPDFASPARASDSDLTPSEFEFLLSYTGLEDIWSALEQSFKQNERAQYAFLRGTRKKRSFNLEAALALVAQFRPAAATIDPNVDLSDEAITAAWAVAINSGV